MRAWSQARSLDRGEGWQQWPFLAAEDACSRIGGGGGGSPAALGWSHPARRRLRFVNIVRGLTEAVTYERTGVGSRLAMRLRKLPTKEQ
jgi:hypothetical protein